MTLHLSEKILDQVKRSDQIETVICGQCYREVGYWPKIYLIQSASGNLELWGAQLIDFDTQLHRTRKLTREEALRFFEQCRKSGETFAPFPADVVVPEPEASKRSMYGL